MCTPRYSIAVRFLIALLIGFLVPGTGFSRFVPGAGLNDALRPQPARSGLEDALSSGLEEPAEIRLGKGEVERFSHLRKAMRHHGRSIDPLEPASFERYRDYPWQVLDWVETPSVRIYTEGTPEMHRTHVGIAFIGAGTTDEAALSTYFRVKDFYERNIPWVDLKVSNLKEVVETATQQPWPNLHSDIQVKAIRVDRYVHLLVDIRGFDEFVQRFPVVLALAAFFLNDFADSITSESGLEEELNPARPDPFEGRSDATGLEELDPGNEDETYRTITEIGRFAYILSPVHDHYPIRSTKRMHLFLQGILDYYRLSQEARVKLTALVEEIDSQSGEDSSGAPLEWSDLVQRMRQEGVFLRDDSLDPLARIWDGGVLAFFTDPAASFRLRVMDLVLSMRSEGGISEREQEDLLNEVGKLPDTLSLDESFKTIQGSIETILQFHIRTSAWKSPPWIQIGAEGEDEWFRPYSISQATRILLYNFGIDPRSPDATKKGVPNAPEGAFTFESERNSSDPEEGYSWFFRYYGSNVDPGNKGFPLTTVRFGPGHDLKVDGPIQLWIDPSLTELEIRIIGGDGKTSQVYRLSASEFDRAVAFTLTARRNEGSPASRGSSQAGLEEIEGILREAEEGSPLEPGGFSLDRVIRDRETLRGT